MLQKVVIPPGIDSEDTDYTDTPKWVAADKVRFYQNYPEKIGGWQNNTDSTFKGVARGDLIPFTTLSDATYICIGTNKHLYVLSGGVYTDITPIADTGSLSNPFVTASGSSTVSVSDTSHGLVTGTTVTFSGASAVAGVTVDGEYEVEAITDSDNYTIIDDDTATATSTGGGTSVSYTYQINAGRGIGVTGLGFGVGAYGEETYGDARSTSGIILPARTWSIARWGEDIIANPRGGDVYEWDSSGGTTSNPATKISNAPAANHIRVSDDRYLILFGCEETAGSGTIDPLLIRWSDQEDYTTWTPSSTNTAGDLRVQADCSQIVTAVTSRGAFLVHTDNTLHALQPLFNDFVFGLTTLGENCGCISPHASIDVNGTVFWMGYDGFYSYDGVVRRLNSKVRSQVFDNMSTARRSQFFAAVNKKFNEVWWFYVDNTSVNAEVNRYVIYNYIEDTWCVGSLERTTWADSGILTLPIAPDASGQLYDHETGTDDAGTAINAYIESGEFELPIEGPGEHFVMIDKIVPDLDITGSVSYTIYTRMYPNSTQVTKGPYTVTPTTTKVSARARGRQFAFKVESSEKEDDWRLGTTRFSLIPDGKR